MSRLVDELAPTPELREAAEAAMRADREAERNRLDPERVERLADALERGDDDTPAAARIVAADVEALACKGVPLEAVERILEAAAAAKPSERAAVTTVARRKLRRAPEPAPEPTGRLPDLDVDDLLADCPPARARVSEVSGVGMVPEDLPALAVIAVTSCVLAARVVGGMRNRNGSPWTVRPHLYIAAEVPSGRGKSLARDMIDEEEWSDVHQVRCSAVGECFREAARRLGDRVADDKAARDCARKERVKLIASPEANRERLREIERILARPPLLLPEVKPLHRVTPANFVRTAQRSGFVAALPDEGRATLAGFLQGRDGQEDVDPLLCAFTGSSYGNSTIAAELRGDHPTFERLHASMFLPIQCGVLSPKTPADARLLQRIETAGLLARILVARPRELSAGEAAAWRARCDFPTGTGPAWRALLVRIGTQPDHGDHPLAPTNPIRVPFSQAAVDLALDYQARTTDSARPGGQHHGKPGEALVARLGDHAVRLAVVLAVLREGRANASEVIEADVARAVRACEGYFEPHCLAVARRAILDPEDDDAGALRAVLAEMREAGQAVVRQRDAQRALGRGWSARRVRAAASELEQRAEIDVTSGDRGSTTFALTRTGA